MYVVRLLNRNAQSQVLHSQALSNLTTLAASDSITGHAGYLFCNCRLLLNVTAELDGEPLTRDNAQQLCIVLFRYCGYCHCSSTAVLNIINCA